MIYLDDADLGVLDLDCEEGFVVAEFAIGWPSERPVVRSRALTDGVLDTTRYVGQRAVTIALRLDNKIKPTQDMLDELSPYLSPRRRPRVVWSVDKVPSNPLHVRSLELRGVEMPLVVNAPKALTVVAQWVATESFSRALVEQCAVALLTGTEEFGREYDLEFDRSYPPSPIFGITYFNAQGNAPTPWTGTITGQVVDPNVLVNDVTITFTGVTLTLGQTIVIDTEARTILRNNDPNDSLYASTNFADWTWDDLLMKPGQNQIRLQATSTSGGNPSFTLCWFDRWHI